MSEEEIVLSELSLEDLYELMKEDLYDGLAEEIIDEVNEALSRGQAPYDVLTTVEPAGDVAWNFEKFLVGRDGTVLGRFKSAVEPDGPELTAAIEAALAA